MGVGVYRHICRSMSGSSLNSFYIATGDHQLIGRTGIAQTVKDDAGKLRVSVLPFQELLTDEYRLHRQTVGQTEQHSAVMVACRVFSLVCRQLIQPLLQFLFQCGGHEDGAAGGCGFCALQNEGSRAGKEPLLLLFSQFLLLALNIRTAGRFAQGRVEVFHVVGLEFLHLHAADIGDNKVLDGGEVGFVGFGCPLVLAALLGQPIHEELCHRHRGRYQECPSCQFMFDLLLSVRCLLFGGKALPFVAALAVLVFVGVSDAVRIAALRYRRPPLVLWVYGGYQNGSSHFRAIKRCDCKLENFLSKKKKK